MMTLTEHYEEAVACGDIEDDPQQRQVLLPLECLSQQLMKRKKITWLWNEVIRGLYLYGEVGVGKTFLMHLFFEQVAIEDKLRFHFHHFMQQIDAQLRRRQGQKNPLQSIARDLAKSARLLCFDEFLVDDVADAMILAELLEALLAQGMVLVATSNIPPDDLYRNGVQRARFMPAIAAIKSHCDIFNLGSARDYRLGRHVELKTWLSPLGENSETTLLEQFNTLEAHSQANGLISVQNRDIAYLHCGERVIWFDFKVLCNLPRSQLDYLELAERFDTIFLSNVPALSEKDTVFAILLIHLIDVMYDRSMRLVVSAAVPLEELYQQGEMLESFKRTHSRLQEMQSGDYHYRHKRSVVKELK